MPAGASPASPRTLAVFAIMLAVTLLATMVLGVIVILARQPRETVIAGLTTANGLVSLVFILLFAVVPVGGPPALVGSYVAARMLAAEPAGRSWRFWGGRGMAIGAALGTLWTLVWFGGILAVAGDHRASTLVLTAGGGAAGALLGLVAGTCCWGLGRAE